MTCSQPKRAVVWLPLTGSEGELASTDVCGLIRGGCAKRNANGTTAAMRNASANGVNRSLWGVPRAEAHARQGGGTRTQAAGKKLERLSTQTRARSPPCEPFCNRRSLEVRNEPHGLIEISKVSPALVWER